MMFKNNIILLNFKIVAASMYMQVGYLFIRKEHECFQNGLYLDPGDDHPDNSFHMLKFI